MPFQKEVLKNGDVYNSQVLLRMREMETAGKEHGKNKEGKKVMFKTGETAQSGSANGAEESRPQVRRKTELEYNTTSIVPKDIS